MNNYPRQADFNLERYLGKWYELVRSKAMPFQKGNDVTAQYTKINDSTIEVFNRELRTSGFSDIKGTATVAGNAHVHVNFSKSYWMRWLFKYDLVVADTDYENYSVCYSDIGYWPFRRRHVWILTRHPVEGKKYLEDKIKFIEQELGVKRNELFFTEHKHF